MDPVVSLDAPKSPLAPGDTGTVTVRVLNSGTTVESYRIDVVGPARGWAKPPAEPLALFPDASGEAVVKFEVPAKNGPRAGTMRIGLRVAAISGAGGSAVEEFDLTISPMVAISAKLAPPNSRGWRKGRHRLLITNEGNIDSSVFLEARDPDELLDCRVSQEAVVPADDTISVPLLVTPLSGGKLIGRPSAHPFEVEIFPNSGQAVALRGSMRQRPLLSPAILVAGVVVLALVAAVLALGGSKPESTAQDRAKGSVVEDDEDTTSPASTTSSTSVAPTTTITTALPNQAAELPSTTLAPGATPGAAPTANPPAPKTGTQTATQSGQPEVPAPAVGETPTEAQPPTATPAPTTPPPPPPTEPAIPSTPPLKFGPFFAGEGVIYVVAQNGDLNFYQDYRMDGSNNGVSGDGWNPNGGRRVGCGFATVQHIFGAEGGVIYAIDSAGNFMYYKDLVRNGTNDACAAGGGWAGGWSMGSGWSGYKFVFYGGNGIIYAVDPSGNLKFCRDSGLDGSFDGACTNIGIGWGDLRQVFASGAPGVIYAVNQAGDLLYFRDLVRNGTNGPGGNSGWVGPLPVGNTWQTMYAVFGGAINNPSYPQGVIYTVASDGTLQWRQDYLQDGSNGIGGNRGWLGYTTIGVGWNGVL